jgi:hypothetical protein
VTDSLFREGGPLNTRKTGADEYRMSITLPTDARGHVGRECPSESCAPGYFKVKNGTGITGGQTVAYCPYCRRAAEPSDFTSESQIQYAKDLVLREATAGISRAFEKALGLGPSRRKRFGGGFLSMELSYKPGALPHVRPPLEDELRRDVVCPRCTLEHAVFGLAIWCPDCGDDIFMTHVAAECASLTASLADVERRRELLGARVAARDIENGLEDVVSVFEATLASILRRALAARGTAPDEITTLLDKKVRNGLQNVDRARELYREHLAVDLARDLSPEDVQFLRATFEKRHPITHNLGLVDRKYLRRAESEELEGRDVRVTAADVGRAIDLTVKVVGDAYRELFPT